MQNSDKCDNSARYVFRLLSMHGSPNWLKPKMCVPIRISFLFSSSSFIFSFVHILVFWRMYQSLGLDQFTQLTLQGKSCFIVLSVFAELSGLLTSCSFILFHLNIKYSLANLKSLSKWHMCFFCHFVLYWNQIAKSNLKAICLEISIICTPNTFKNPYSLFFY